MARIADAAGNDGTRERSTAYYISLLVVIVLLNEIVAFEFSFVYPALRELTAAFDTANVSWVVTIAFLVGGMVTPIIGKASDMLGKKRVILWMSGTFALGSVICAVAPSFSVLLAGRALQGTSVALSAVSYGLIRDTLPRRLVPIGVGMLATGIGLSGIAGPLLGGMIIDQFGFRGVFWFLFGYALVFAGTLFLVAPESPVRARQRIDVVGALLLAGGIGALLLAVSEAPRWGLGSAATILCGTVGLALVLLFGVVERRTAEPMMDMALLARPAVWATLLAAFLTTFVIGAHAFLTPQMLQTPRLAGIDYGFGLSALDVAFYQTLPQGLAAMVCGLLGGLLARRRGPQRGLLVAQLCATTSVALLAVLHTQPWQPIVLSGLAGIGIGFYFASAPNLIIEAVPPTQQGVSAGMLAVFQSTGSAAATTVSGALLAQNVHARSPDGQVVYTTGGFQNAYLAAAAIGVAALVVTVAMRHGRGPATGGVAAG